MRFKNEVEKMRWYRTTVRGHVSSIYNHQKRNSLVRGHPMPSYSFKWLADKSEKCEDYMRIHNIWVAAGCPKHLSPSYDRIRDDDPYTEDNIQIMTWRENEQKSYDDMRSGKIVHGANPQVAVYQYTPYHHQILVAKYHSMQEASRQTGIPAGNICKACKGERLTAGGFEWSYYEFISLFS